MNFSASPTLGLAVFAQNNKTAPNIGYGFCEFCKNNCPIDGYIFVTICDKEIKGGVCHEVI